MVLCIPVLVAIQNVLLRHMRGLHEYTVASYVIFSGGVAMGVASLFLEQDH